MSEKFSPFVKLTEVMADAEKAGHVTRGVYVNLIHVSLVRPHGGPSSPAHSVVTMSNGEVFFVADTPDTIHAMSSD